MQRIIKNTADGSPTFFVPGLNEHYHSLYGAIQESEHVFIENGLRKITRETTFVLEIGMGTGLNALLSWKEAETKSRIVCYHALEKYPLAQKEWENYGSFLKIGGTEKEVFMAIHQCQWDKEYRISPLFTLKKIHADLTNWQHTGNYDVIYFDAFGPEVQPELWTAGIFSQISQLMNPGAILTTYSAKGQVKRNLESAGLSVTRIPGPPGKREMIVARKPVSGVIPN